MKSFKPIYAIITIIIIAVITVISVTISISISRYNLNQKMAAFHSKGLLSIYDIFKSEEEYNNYVLNSISFEGISFKEYDIVRGDNYWKVAKNYNVNIDTLIAVNPFWQDIYAATGDKVLVPSIKGSLAVIDDLDYIDELTNQYNVSKKDIIVQKIPNKSKYFYKLTPENEFFFIFIKNSKPLQINMTASLHEQYEIRELFRSPLGGRFSSFFGRRRHPIFKKVRLHNGIDIASKYGTWVGASRQGKVISTGWMGGYGKAVVILHDNGYKTLYGHLSRITVRSGQNVKSGQLIGKVGSTGNSTGPHLHFTLWKNDRLINPMKVLW